jgi:hypothetical protein
MDMRRNHIYVLLLVGVLASFAYFTFQPSTLINSGSITPETTIQGTEIDYEDLDAMYGPTGFCIGSEEAIKKGEFIVRTEKEYQDLTRFKSIHFSCHDFTLPPLDFSKKSLLAKYTSGGGCKVEFIRKVYRDEVNKKIIYAIKILQHGSCKKKVASMNWIQIPPIPNDYQVEFHVEKE